MKKTILILASLLIAVSVYSQASWSLTGNSGISASNFIGTTDNSPLIFRTNNQFAGTTGFPNKKNVAFGWFALNAALSGTGDENTVMGSYAMPWNSMSSRGVAIGRFALESSFTGDENVAVGYATLGESGAPGDGNVAVGAFALRRNNRSYNTAVGYHAAHNNTTGEGITAIGFRSLWYNTTGEFNTAIGHNSLLYNTTGFWNVALGSGNLQHNSTGFFNTSAGNSAMHFNTTGVQNSAFGQQALAGNIDGSYNTAVGCMALWSVSHDGPDNGYGHGECNTAVGYEALKTITTGGWNVAVGVQTLRNNSTGNGNITLGCQALFDNTTGSDNVAVGNAALRANIDGNDNVAIGYLALNNNTTGNNNVAIGYMANVGSNNLSNATAIGHNAIVTASDQVKIGNNSVTSIGGVVPWSNISDRRIKKNISENVPGLNFIKKLRPVTYNIDLDAADELIKSLIPKDFDEDSLKYKRPEYPINRESREANEKRLITGFAAQDVEKAAQSIGYEFSGVDVDESGIYALRYSEFVVPLVKAVQELSSQNEALQKEIVVLQNRIKQLEIVSDTEKMSSLQSQVKELSGMVKRLMEKENSPAFTTNNGVSVSDASLEQNFPNPFNQLTTINYTLPQMFGSAKIVISDTSGRVCRQIEIKGAGGGSTTVAASSLSAGVYYYSLIVDNMLVDTKKMMLTR